MSKGTALPGGFGCGSLDGMHADAMGRGLLQRADASHLHDTLTMVKVDIQMKSIVKILLENSLTEGTCVELKSIMSITLAIT